MSIAASEMNDVFYNPVQVQNRDLSILMLQLYQERRQDTLQQQFDQYRLKRQELRLAKQQREQQEQEEQQQQQPKEGTMAAAEDDNTGTTKDMTIHPSSSTPATANTSASKNTTTLPDDDDDLKALEVPKVQLQVLDALAASGLRSLRYWKECQDLISHITINDIDPSATQRAHSNIELNELSDVLIPPETRGRPHGIRICTSDATDIMYHSRHKRQKRPKQLPSLKAYHPHPRDPPPDDIGILTPEQESQLNWDVIDLDPYGSAAGFIDSAVQAITHGGLLNVTCTDMRTMSGAITPETSFCRYGAMPIRDSPYFQDYAIRMVLYSIAAAAGRHGRSIKPILSVGMDFYVRVFVEVYDDKRSVRELPLKCGMVYQSTQCPSFFTLPMAVKGGANGETYQSPRIPSGVCPETGAPLKVGGPIWLGPLHDPEVLQKAIQRLEQPTSSGSQQSSSSSLDFIATRERLHGLLTSCLEELPDVPLYYVTDTIARCVHISAPPLVEVKSALINAGYRVSGYHKEPLAIKTDAPSSIVWDIVRAFVKRRPLVKPPAPGSTAEKIFSVEPSIEVDFRVPLALYQRKEAFFNVKRFPGNPERNWGPKQRAQKRNRTNDE